MYPYVIVDVFTDTPLEGNPLAVFTAGQDIPTARMQQLARETNLSETVFVLPAEGDADARIRIFTPAIELPFAGHPTLGTAFVLAQRAGADTIRLETGVGPVPIEFTRDGDRVTGRMSQPIPEWQPYEDAADLLKAIGIESAELPIEVYQNGPRHVYIALDSEKTVASLDPDMTALGKHVMGVNCFAGSGTTWKTRVFCPGMGVPEDPATGSAAGPLAVHLARHGRAPFGEDIEIHQGAEIGRPSKLYARVEGTPGQITKVEVAGSSVIVAHGQFTI